MTLPDTHIATLTAPGDGLMNLGMRDSAFLPAIDTMGILAGSPLSELAKLYETYGAPHLLYIAIGAVFLYTLSHKYASHLRAIPGPYWAGYTGLWRAWQVYKGDFQHQSIALHQKYGPLVRIGPNQISIADSSAIKIIYGVNGGFTKTAFYPIQEGRFEKKRLINVFAARDESFHARIKRPIGHVYSMAALTDLEFKIDHVSKLFMDKLKEHERNNKNIDLGEWLQWYAFDVIGNLTFSKTLGFVEQSRDIDDMIATLGNFFVYAAVIGQIPYLHKVLVGNPLLPYIMPAIESFNPAVNFAVKCMKESKENVEEGRDDFLIRFQKMVKAGSKGGHNGGAFEDADIVNHTSTNVLAGSDTTAIALRAIIHNLITNPLCYNKLQSELDEWDAAGKLSDPIQESEARRLPFLQAVLKEAMRIHPSVGLIMERHVPKGGTTISGTFIPEGTIVGINPWVVARDKRIYGEDADIFRPERWLEADEEQLKEMERSSLVFGAGSRSCIGKHISMMEMSKIIPQMFREFDITLVTPQKDLQTIDYWFAVQRGLVCDGLR
ncbi:unnamed protein product [Clonostachys rosea f. rosea IK726]|uniref:Uncharacterized protein n=1 Tax=Clonostachys rosea f. rosea IK726 TaxID=1349383 RepID=A0ACA9UDP3_BIOOC|nr:unnamed protein product [Clonostachys rosea f. rosea IK726]